MLYNYIEISEIPRKSRMARAGAVKAPRAACAKSLKVDDTPELRHTPEAHGSQRRGAVESSAIVAYRVEVPLNISWPYRPCRETGWCRSS